MTKNRVIAICLDAFDKALGEKLMAEGKMQGLARLRAASARFELEHGAGNKARYTGLTWEHFSSGCRPETSGKWSVVPFDPKAYKAYQLFATERPFLADADVKAVILDAPYWNLRAMPNGVGAVGWSGHDTGVRPYSQPAGLFDELKRRFGAPADVHTLNTMVYPSLEDTRAMADTLVRGVHQRAKAAHWLLQDYAADWDVAVIGFGETHDAIELFYHGMDPEHLAADFPTAALAREGLIRVYEAMSEEVARLMDTYPDATIVAFTMHGMGKNDTDLPTMLLLPELLYRMSFGRALFTSREDWKSEMPPALKADEEWNSAVIAQMRHPSGPADLALRAAKKVRRMADRLSGNDPYAHELEDPNMQGIGWMPAAQYSRYWPQMQAFAQPAYFDGRARVNLKGRETHGTVELADYKATLDRIEAALNACVDIKTGEPVVREIVRPGEDDPLNLPDTQADIKVIWNGSPIGFRHPEYGDLGPAPMRRMGGHSGGFGALYVHGPSIEPGDRGLRSSFDVAPTIMGLLNQPRPNRMDGTSLVEELTGASVR